MKLQTAKPAHRPSRRSDLLAAALEVLATNDPSDVSIDTIATSARMTTAAVYYHFASRTEIVDTLVSTIIDKVAGFFAPRPDHTELEAWGRDSMGRTLNWMRTDPLEVRFLLVRMTMTQDGAETLIQFRKETGRLVASMEHTISTLDDSIDPVEVAVMARAMWALLAETARAALANRKTVPQNFRSYERAAAVIAARILAR